jgi:hypothetical protein
MYTTATVTRAHAPRQAPEPTLDELLNLGLDHVFHRRYPLAVETFRRCRALDPRHAVLIKIGAIIYRNFM